MTIFVTNLSVRGNVEATGHKVFSAELGDLEIIDAREKSSDKLYVHHIPSQDFNCVLKIIIIALMCFS